MGAWVRCDECGGRTRVLKVMESEEKYTSEETVARKIIGILSTKKMARQCLNCGDVKVVRVNLRRK